MNLGEQPLLVILVAFIAGIALGRVWARVSAASPSERTTRGTSSIHYILGLDLVASGQIDRAITELTLAARNNTEAIEIYLILGNLLREKGQLERAIQIHQSILHRPGLTRTERAHTLLCLGMDFKRAGFRKRAMDTFQEVGALEPENAHALVNLIKLYEEEHEWEAALSTQEKLAEVTGTGDPTLQAFLYDRIAQDAGRAGAFPRATQAFEQALRLDERVAPTYLHYGDMLEGQGRLEEAEARWLSLASAHPKMAYLVFERLARVRNELGHPTKMPELYEQIIEDDEEDWRAHVALARLLRERGEEEAAFELLLRAVRNNPHALAVHLEIWSAMPASRDGGDPIKRYLDEVGRSAFFLDPHICMKCNYRANGILWRCPHCQEWNTFVEERLETVDP